MASMVEVFNVGKSFGRNTLALWDISFTVKKGQLMVISGPADSGKTTLLRVICGQLLPSEGHVLVDGVNVAGVIPSKRQQVLGRAIGIVPSRPLVLKGASAVKTVLLALASIGIHGTPALLAAQDALDLAGLLHRSNSPTSALSEPERRSLSIARALATRPRVLLADDPIIGLDNSAAKDIMTILNRASDQGTTVIMATRADNVWQGQSPDAVCLLAGRIQHLSGRAKRLNSKEDMK